MKLIKLILPTIAITAVALPIVSCTNQEKTDNDQEIVYLTEEQVNSHFDQLKNINSKDKIELSRAEVPELFKKFQEAFGEKIRSVQNTDLEKFANILEELSKIENIINVADYDKEQDEERPLFNFFKIDQNSEETLITDKNLKITSATIKTLSDSEIEISDIEFKYYTSENKDEAITKTLNLHFNLV